jgi:hypothetical protein
VDEADRVCDSIEGNGVYRSVQSVIDNKTLMHKRHSRSSYKELCETHTHFSTTTLTEISLEISWLIT